MVKPSVTVHQMPALSMVMYSPMSALALWCISEPGYTTRSEPGLSPREADQIRVSDPEGVHVTVLLRPGPHSRSCDILGAFMAEAAVGEKTNTAIRAGLQARDFETRRRL